MRVFRMSGIAKDQLIFVCFGVCLLVLWRLWCLFEDNFWRVLKICMAISPDWEMMEEWRNGSGSCNHGGN